VVSSLGAEAFSEVVAVGISNLSVARFGEVMERVSDQKTFIGGCYRIDGKFKYL
jgi:hypothetical protein